MPAYPTFKHGVLVLRIPYYYGHRRPNAFNSYLRACLHTSSIFIFAFYPTLIIAQIGPGVFKAVEYHLRIRSNEDEEKQSNSQKPTVSFYFCGILGMHAKVDHDAFPGQDEDYPAMIPLFSAGHCSLQRTAYQITWHWPIRILLSTSTLTQAVLAVLIWIRRLQHDSILVLDTFNGVMALSSVIASLLALVLLLLRYEWKVQSPIQQMRRFESHPLTLAKPLALAYLVIGPIRGCLYFSLPITPTWMNVVWRDRLLVLGAILCLAVILFRRQEVIRKLRQRHARVEVAILWAIVGLAVGDLEYTLGSAIGELIEGRHGGWKDPLSDRMLVI